MRHRKGRALRKRYGHAGTGTGTFVNRKPGFLYYVDGKGEVRYSPMKHRSKR